ncbi:uncharacterized protein LOC110982422 [Acanthaster planci]|uniref:Uncharacterized protein LOC110982422 n=1 Tax=Acanthaster planci TaxID=133434 RepID=A0A8B7YT87_ACAPL|nr:uncharacterized protein LOC110982422 [Acanthaster planci]
MKVLLLSMLTLSVCVAGSYAVRCYACTGAISPALNTWCNDPFDEENAAAQASIQTCNGECVKSYSKIGDLEGYVRECSNVTITNCLNECNSALGITACQHCCTGDLCNSASSVTFNLLAAVAMLVSAWVFTS